MPRTPEDQARETIDRQLAQAGWVVQSVSALNLHAGRGVAVRELQTEHGPCDYMLFVDRQAVGVLEAKSEGSVLTNHELQPRKYSEGMPAGVPAPIKPLPFLYLSTGVETRFASLLDPEPKYRNLFHLHRPETLAEWLARDPVWLPAGHRLANQPASFRLGLTQLPELHTEGLWPAQRTAIQNLEKSFAADRPRALIQMATGSGKTFTAVSTVYRLIKHAGARRILFLVDRGNLARQAEKEFQQYITPDDGRKFAELYNIQRMTTNRVDGVAKVCIGTIQRMYAMLQGKEFSEEDEEAPLSGLEALHRQPLPVVYNPDIPVETFDVVIVDECHRSIYTLWRQVLEYYDAFLVGLTATPAKQTFGFFNQNLVMEYGHEAAVADGVNVDFDVYRIRTRITERGSTVEAGLWVDRRDRETRATRWEQLDEELSYDAGALDRDVVAPDQIRTVLRAYKAGLATLFPGRTEVPKTLIYAKDDAHADDIVKIVREEFGKGNDFVQKITYRTGTARVMERVVGPDGAEREVSTWKSTGIKAEDLLSAFRNSYNPRIAVTVDMIATGTDIKPLEVVMFLRQVRSRNLFEQMKGRGVRVINDTDFRAVTPDGGSKTRFVIVDTVGVTEQELSDTHPLERKPSVSLEKLLQAVAMGNTDPDVISSVAGRLARLDRQLSKPDREMLERASDGVPLRQITAGLVAAIDPDRESAGGEAIAEACQPLAANPALRQLLVELKRSKEQVVDTVSQDEILDAGYSAEATERAKAMTTSFEQFVRENKDEITALQILYSRPYGQRLRFEDIRALADAIQAPPRQWTPERLWQAYETLFASRVRGAPGRVLTNLVSLVRFAVEHETLVPFPDLVNERFAGWLSQQEQRGRVFSEGQKKWLADIRDHIAANLEVTPDDFEYAPFAQRGGLGAAHRVFGDELTPLLDELTRELAA